MNDRSGSFMRFLRPSKKTILLIAITSAVTLVISSLIFMWLIRVPNRNMGTIKFQGVEGYWDENLTNKTETCDWGTIWPGVSKNLTLYLRSISNVETTLDLISENWTFWKSNNYATVGPAQTTPYMNLTWNYDNTIVKPSEVLRMTLTLSVDRSSDFIKFLIANDVKAFSVDIIISTSENS